MTPDQAAAYVMAQSVLLSARIAGMMAENMQRQHRNESMAYTEEHFSAAAQEYAVGHNTVLALYEDSQP